MVGSINSNNKDKLSVTIGGVGAYATVKVAKKPINALQGAYTRTFCTNQPVLFEEEAKYFDALHDYVRDIAGRNPNHYEIGSINDKLSMTGAKTEELILSASDLIKSKNVQESMTYSNKFLDLGKLIHFSDATDDEIKKCSEKLLANKALCQTESDILNAIVKNPAAKKELYPVGKYNALSVYRKIYNMANDVVLHPDLKKLARQMYDEGGLSQKGVSYVMGDPEFFETREQQLVRDYKRFEENALKKYTVREGDNKIIVALKNFGAKSIRNKYKKELDGSINLVRAIKKGENACYSHLYKEAVVPAFTERREAIFHELGHAINYNKSAKITKTIGFFKRKLPKIVLPLIFCSSVFLKKADKPKKINEAKNLEKPQQEPQKKSFVRKTREVIKNNIMSFALLISAPNVIEEWYASHRAVKFLKGKVTQQQLKNIKIKSLESLGSYGLVALASAGVFKLAVFVSDKIQTEIKKGMEKKK